MAISTGAKIGLLAAAGLFVASTAANAVDKLKDLSNKFLFNVFFKRIHSLNKGILTLVYGVDIKNLSGMNVSLNEAYILLQFSKDNGMNWDNIGASTNKVKNLALPDNKTTSQEFPIQINLSDTFNSLLQKSNKYRIVVKYNAMGIPLQWVKAYDFTSTLKKIPGFKGVEDLTGPKGKVKTPQQKKAYLSTIIIQIRQVFPASFPLRPAKKLVKFKKPGLPKKPVHPLIPAKLNQVFKSRPAFRPVRGTDML